MKISIITVAYNSAATIRETLTCIKEQDYPDIEHIIIDGLSTDETLQIVAEFPHVARVISERDGGLYDAMNKGIQLATGNVIGILNSDDIYSDIAVLSKVMRILNENVASCVYGDLQYVDATNPQKIVRTWKSGHYQLSSFYYGWMPPHPTFFVRREVYNDVGLFNTSLNSAADYELMLRILFKNRLKAVYLPEILVKMRVGGLSSSSFRQRLRANKEDRLAWKINQLDPYFFTLLLKPLRKVFQFLIK